MAEKKRSMMASLPAIVTIARHNWIAGLDDYCRRTGRLFPRATGARAS